MFGNNEELLENMWEALQNFKEGIAFYPMDNGVINFIKRVAISKGGQNYDT